MRTISRILIVAVWLFSGAAFAGPSPLYNWVDVPIATPTTAQRVKAVIVNAALVEEWSIVENADGSLTAWREKFCKGSWQFKVRIAYDAQRYSITYVDSAGLSYTQTYLQDFDAEKEKAESDRAKAKVDKRKAEAESQDAALEATVRSWPDGQRAVKTDGHMHSSGNNWIRDLMTGIRRGLAAPPI